MNPSPTLSGSHLRAWQTIFQHPVSHNLQWREVHGLLEHLGDLSEEPNGNLKATRNGQSLVLHPPRTKDVAETEEAMALRHFLERSETVPAETPEPEKHWLLVIDHQRARVFRSAMHGAVPELILPHAPEDFFRHTQDSKDSARGKEKPDPNSFFEPVAQALQAAGEILILGAGTGMSSEMDQFIGWVKVHHPEVARRIVGSVPIDESHLTENQLLAKARDFYAGARTSEA